MKGVLGFLSFFCFLRRAGPRWLFPAWNYRKEKGGNIYVLLRILYFGLILLFLRFLMDKCIELRTVAQNNVTITQVLRA